MATEFLSPLRNRHPTTQKITKILHLREKKRRDFSDRRPDNNNSCHRPSVNSTDQLQLLYRERKGGRKGRETWWCNLQSAKPHLVRPRRLGFWYLGASIRFIMRKARAVYNGFHCPRVVGREVTLVDAHFSLPVIPATTVQ